MPFNVLQSLYLCCYGSKMCVLTCAGGDGRESPVSLHNGGGAGMPLLASPSPAASPTPFAQHSNPAGAAAPPAGSSPIAGSAGMMATVEGSRLEGVILRSQLLVLLQRRHFCDQHGRPVGREYSEKQEIELEVRFGGDDGCGWILAW